MKLTDFRCPDAGAIQRSMAGHDTFVPAPLPPDISYDSSLVLALSRADTALSELSGVGRQLPNPHLLITPYLRQEAILSSRIEGTRTNLAELLLDDVGEAESNVAAEADRREVRNYVQAMEAGIEELRTNRPVNLNLVRSLHAILTTGVRGGYASPGQFRREQNWIGGATIDRAVYVPPPVERLMDCLSDWEEFINMQGVFPDLIQCALMHAQFEAIHPFNDGNGRIGRLLIPLFLMERGRLSQPLLYLSSYIEPRRDTYYDLLQGIRTDCNWSPWLRFFLDGVEQTALLAVRQTKLLMDLREEYRSLVRGKARAIELVDHLFLNPYVTAKRAQGVLTVSDPTARSVIATLEQAGVVSNLGEAFWPRLYVSSQILSILTALDSSDSPGA
jgi:Fic family protein